MHESEDGELAVVAVPVHPGAPPLRLVSAVVESAPDEAGEEVELDETWNPLELPVYPTEQRTIERLHKLIAGFPDYDGYERNNRPVQPLNGREILNDTG